MNRYYDNAATSHPKPPEVGQAMLRYLTEVGAPYGRSAYPRAFAVAKTVEATRDRLAHFLGAGKPENLVFTPNATVAINTVLSGFLPAGSKVLTSALEHNAVVRPLEVLAKTRNINVGILPSFDDGLIDISRVTPEILEGVTLVVVNHQSNVNGLIQPLPILKKAFGDIPLLVDASQSAGGVPIRIDDWNIDFLAVTGHKGLLGPTGTGALFMRHPELVTPFIFGGTGSASDRAAMPEFQPDKFEAGTGNIAGIFGLQAALEHRPQPRHSLEDLLFVIRQLRKIPKLLVHSASDENFQGEVFSISHPDLDPADLGNALWEHSGIEVRVGLHCAPQAHRTLGSFPSGTVRFSPSPYHGRKDLEFALHAIQEKLIS